MSWCSGSAARAPRAVALLLTFDDVGDEPEVLIDPADLEPAVLVRVAPIRDLRPVLDHQVEEVAAHLDGDPRVGGDFALDLDLRHLEPKLLDVAAALQVHPHDQLELLERGDLVEEAAHRLLDELRGVLRSHVRTLAPRGRPADLPTNAPRAAAEHERTCACWALLAAAWAWPAAAPPTALPARAGRAAGRTAPACVHLASALRPDGAVTACGR